MKKLVTGVLIAMLASPVVADDSVDHSAQASKHSVLASVEGASVGTVKLNIPFVARLFVIPDEYSLI